MVVVARPQVLESAIADKGTPVSTREDSAVEQGLDPWSLLKRTDTGRSLVMIACNQRSRDWCFPGNRPMQTLLPQDFAVQGALVRRLLERVDCVAVSQPLSASDEAWSVLAHALGQVSEGRLAHALFAFMPLPAAVAEARRFAERVACLGHVEDASVIGSQLVARLAPSSAGSGSHDCDRATRIIVDACLGALSRVQSLAEQLREQATRAREDAVRWKLAHDRKERAQRRLTRQLDAVFATARYRIGDAVVRAATPSSESIRLPVRMLEIAGDRLVPKLRNLGGKRFSVSVLLRSAWARLVGEAGTQAALKDGFSTFQDDLATAPTDHLVLMLSGTTYLQGVQANRPIRLARTFAASGVSVVFVYFRWGAAEQVPRYVPGSRIFQCPIDHSAQVLRRLATRPSSEGMRLYVLTFPHPVAARTLGRFRRNGWAVIYDCRDDWEEFHRSGHAVWFSRPLEQYVVRHAHATTCVSAALVEKMQRLGPDSKIELLPNGLDTTFIPAHYRHEPEEPPIVGYFGHLCPSWFHWEALGEIARARPQYRFEIIGHSGAPRGPVSRNVCLLGARATHELPGVARRWSAAIIPFRVSALADAVDPIKVYEYLALGLPVVSFRMPQIRDYPCVQTAESTAEFLKCLDTAVNAGCNQTVVRTFLAVNRWEDRAARMLEIAESVCAPKRR